MYSQFDFSKKNEKLFRTKNKQRSEISIHQIQIKISWITNRN